MAVTGNSQQEVLAQLLERKSGATLDELVTAVGLSRTAVNQHLIALEREGYVRKGAPRKTGGRPQHIYVLTEEGTNLFPKQYSWFSKLLIQTLREQLGEEQLGRYMYDLGVKMSADLIPRLVGKNRVERIAEIVKIMNETGFRGQYRFAERSRKAAAGGVQELRLPRPVEELPGGLPLRYRISLRPDGGRGRTPSVHAARQ